MGGYVFIDLLVTLGYVGLPLARKAAFAGFSVIGLDVDASGSKPFPRLRAWQSKSCGQLRLSPTPLFLN